MTKFKVGDKVRVVGDNNSHCYPIGHVGFVEEVLDFQMGVGPDKLCNWVVYDDAELVTDEGSGYNDGKWHVWQGNGECPIDDGVRGDITYADGEKLTDVRLDFYEWHEPLMFRVTKAHREPREVYFAKLGVGAWLEVIPDHPKAVLFREVLD